MLVLCVRLTHRSQNRRRPIVVLYLFFAVFFIAKIHKIVRVLFAVVTWNKNATHWNTHSLTSNWPAEPRKKGKQINYAHCVRMKHRVKSLSLSLFFIFFSLLRLPFAYFIATEKKKTNLKQTKHTYGKWVCDTHKIRSLLILFFFRSIEMAVVIVVLLLLLFSSPSLFPQYNLHLCVQQFSVSLNA